MKKCSYPRLSRENRRNGIASPLLAALGFSSGLRRRGFGLGAARRCLLACGRDRTGSRLRSFRPDARCGGRLLAISMDEREAHLIADAVIAPDLVDPNLVVLA